MDIRERTVRARPALRAAAAVAFAWVLLLSPARAAGPVGADPPAVPLDIEVPPGHSVFAYGSAFGTQNFICLATPSGVGWRFTGPQATLFLTFRGAATQQIATHFLSPNPDESGTPRPTWQHSFDTSAVWGRVRSASSDPAYVEPGAIPWLLLDAQGVERGPTGGAHLTHTQFIHRVNTAGGLAPATGCASPADVGAVALVPYQADYFFYKAGR
jgi:hypothetical protein